MSPQEELTAVQHCLDDLVRTVGRLERSLARLREAEAGPAPLEAAGRTEPVDVPCLAENCAPCAAQPEPGTLRQLVGPLSRR
ncbi:hypothetical protein [Streptomyces sp. BE133]|uniref:hypothetical protein n=1 Tax=Streptomyces sp. BE133 TaxID=3002523 RepID=UPI003FA756F1